MRIRAALLIALAALTTAQSGPGDATDPVDDPVIYCDGDGGALGAQTDAEHERIMPPLVLPKRIRSQTVSVGGIRTRLLAGGPRKAREAVVFAHGNPGSSKDWLDLARRTSRFARVIAFDGPGFGDSGDPSDFEYSPENYGRWIGQLLKKLKVRRAHLVLHDFGGPWGLEWAAAHPRQVESVVLFNTGVFIGYFGHALAHVWRTPGVGESSMAATNRDGFHRIAQNGQQKPLPEEFVDRMYDDFDRATRCAVLRLYRATDNPDGMGRRQAAALKPHDIPALVVWGENDPYLPTSLAETQKQAFPHARIVIFEGAAHWPFIDFPERAAAEAVPFLRKQVKR